MEGYIEMAARLGLQGNDAIEFIREQQQAMRDERAQRREENERAAELRRQEDERTAELRRQVDERAAELRQQDNEQAERAVELRRQEAELKRQEDERAERAEERRAEERRLEREHALRMAQVQQHITNTSSSGSVSSAAKQRCKIPAFVDRTDNLDSYLPRYERFARTNE